MEISINETITDWCTLNEGFIYRDGFVFTRGKSNSAVFDRLVIRVPMRTRANERKQGYSYRSLDEHIALVNKLQINKVRAICDDLHFLLQCPSVSDVQVSPSYDAPEAFDYSPLYKMPCLRRLDCQTVYGTCEQYKTTIDYSQIQGLEYIAMVGGGHVGYEKLPHLRELWISQNRTHKNFEGISYSDDLEKITVIQSKLQTLNGIEAFSNLKSLVMYNNYSLRDISALQNTAETLRYLVIENCSKIKDFSSLASLSRLQHLQLYGNNTIPNLTFLRNMPQLKTFTFTMNVEDGDLSLCRNIPYVSCKSRKHYNFKDAQLPKILEEENL